jgi:hypothetical protein
VTEQRWTYTRHAKERCVQRGVMPDELRPVLDDPQVTLPDPKGDPCRRLYGRGDLWAIVNPSDRVVVTIGFAAEAEEWEALSATRRTDLIRDVTRRTA